MLTLVLLKDCILTLIANDAMLYNSEIIEQLNRAGSWKEKCPPHHSHDIT